MFPYTTLINIETLMKITHMDYHKIKYYILLLLSTAIKYYSETNAKLINDKVVRYGKINTM